MDRSFLVRRLGFPATLIHGDTLVLDRWRWLKRRLPRTRNGERLLDIGCGSGAFSIGATLRGYQATGVSWDEDKQRIAQERASICRAESAAFEVLDVRQLHTKTEYVEKYDFAVCCENIEHVLDDRKLIQDIAACLKPGGHLLLTTPNYYYRSMSPSDDGPFCKTETGWHVRRGYTKGMLLELCEQAGLVCEDVSFCSGFLSQKTTTFWRILRKWNSLFAWVSTLPLRPLPLAGDNAVTRLLRYPFASICIEAYKPRYNHDSITRKGLS